MFIQSSLLCIVFCLGSVVAKEQATYVTYVNDIQRKLQADLEKESSQYSETLNQVIGKQAGLHCRRDQLWSKLLLAAHDCMFLHKNISQD